MKSKGCVYGFIGPAGGGKTYSLNQLRELANREERTFIEGDFSDGIRHTMLQIFGLGEKSVKLSSDAYLTWKDADMPISVPVGDSLVTGNIKGRELLKNIGEYLKKLAGENVWAKWTGNDICRKYWSLSDDVKRNDSIIAFGSVRFESEIRMLFSVADLMNKDVKLIFCNHFNEEFNPSVHISESLAHQLILRDAEDGEDVTQIIRVMYQIK